MWSDNDPVGDACAAGYTFSGGDNTAIIKIMVIIVFRRIYINARARSTDGNLLPRRCTRKKNLSQCLLNIKPPGYSSGLIYRLGVLYRSAPDAVSSRYRRRAGRETKRKTFGENVPRIFYCIFYSTAALIRYNIMILFRTTNDNEFHYSPIPSYLLGHANVLPTLDYHYY